MAGEIRVDILNELQDQKTSGGQASTSHDDQTKQINNENDKNAEEVNDLTKYCLGELIQDDQTPLAEQKREEAEAQSSQPQATIDKVPQIIIRENEGIKKYYKPRQISIGPIHANDPELSKRELKLKLAREFTYSSGVTAYILFEGIQNKIKDIEKCFSKDVIPKCYNDDSLARLLFLDGCAVLQFMVSSVSDKLKDFKIKRFEATSMKLDLFLFENQIPFEVLNLLMENIKDKDRRKDVYGYLLNFVLGSNICDGVLSDEKPEHLPIEEYIKKKKPDHLLDLLRTVCIHGSVKEVENEDNKPDKRGPESICFKEIENGDKKSYKREYVSILFEALINIFLGQQKEIRYFRNVQELKSSGIRMKPSGSRSLNSVSFNSHCFGFRGHLKLPILTMRESTICHLLNLVAYEMWLDDDDKHDVTSYLALMNLLIDTEQDVKDLRVAKILGNPNLGDAKIAELFNMTDSICLSRYHDCHVLIKDAVEKHYRNKYAIWIAEVFNNHFSNPWTIVAFVAAVIALLLTFVQTWYAINPKK